MKILHRSLGLVLFILMACAAAWVLYAACSSSMWGAMVEQIDAHKWRFVAGGLLVFLLVVLYSYSGSRRSDRDRYLSFDGDGGSVRISLRAIREFLAGLGAEYATVEEIRPEFTVHDRAIDVELHVTVRAGCQIPELSRRLQERVRSSMRESLGLAEVRNVHVLIQEIVTVPRRRPAAEPASEWGGDLP